MPEPNRSSDELLEKIRSLSPERLAEVEDFVDFLIERYEDRALVHDMMKLSEESLAKVWDNPDDAVYDRL